MLNELLTEAISDKQNAGKMETNSCKNTVFDL